jgi:flagellar hook assembly protein FlgD
MSTTGVTSSGAIRMDYMKLLVTQLQNQNPLDPMSNDQMAAQLAQFSQLEQLEKMNDNFGSMSENIGSKLGSMDTNFASVLASSNRTYANSLLDKNVSYLSTDELTGRVESGRSIVSGISSDVEGNPVLQVDRHTLDLDGVIDSLMGKNVSYYTKVGDTTGISSGKITGVNTSILGEESFVIDGHAISAKDIITDSLTNQKVSYLTTNELTGVNELKNLTISEIENDADGKMIFTLGKFINLASILSVQN